MENIETNENPFKENALFRADHNAKEAGDLITLAILGLDRVYDELSDRDGEEEMSADFWDVLDGVKAALRACDEKIDAARSAIGHA